MKFLNIGKIVNTFGIKGELKVVSRFEMANKVFIKGNTIYINEKPYLITNARFHHYNYLIELNNIKDINEIEFLIGENIYFKEEDLQLKDNEYLISELINYEVIDNNELIGKVTDYDDNKINPLIKINNKYYIPIKGDFITKVDKNKHIIYVKNGKGLIL